MRQVILRRAFAAAIGLFVLMQFIPYGREHTNPPVIMEPSWDSDETRELVKRTCYNCHSNTTVWPWYSQVAPISWLVQYDVEEARAHLNFSEWQRRQKNADEASAELREGEMPPSKYLLLHPEARLSDLERARLMLGLEKTFAASGKEKEGVEE